MAAEKLFYEEGAFKLIVYCGVAILGLLFIAGLLYEGLVKKYLQRKSILDMYTLIEWRKQFSKGWSRSIISLNNIARHLTMKQLD